MRRRGPLNTRSPSAEVTSLQKGIFKMALDQGVSNNSLQSTDREPVSVRVQQANTWLW